MLRAVAAPTAMAAYDWDRTRAFAVPTDQHGMVRINLAGREARGIVPAERYAATCDELSEALLGTCDADGRPLVRRILRLAGDNGGRPPEHLPISSFTGAKPRAPTPCASPAAPWQHGLTACG